MGYQAMIKKGLNWLERQGLAVTDALEVRTNFCVREQRRVCIDDDTHFDGVLGGMTKWAMCVFLVLLLLKPFFLVLRPHSRFPAQSHQFR